MGMPTGNGGVRRARKGTAREGPGSAGATHEATDNALFQLHACGEYACIASCTRAFCGKLVEQILDPLAVSGATLLQKIILDQIKSGIRNNKNARNPKFSFGTVWAFKWGVNSTTSQKVIARMQLAAVTVFPWIKQLGLRAARCTFKLQ